MRYILEPNGSVSSSIEPPRALTAGHVLVHVHAFCLILPDIPRSGYSFAGTVIEAFEGEVWQIGAKVWGYTSTAGYSDQVIVPQWAVYKMRTDRTFAKSATLAGPALLGVHAMQIGQVPATGRPKVLIHGGNTAIGTFAIQAARVMKCDVEVTTPLEHRERCRQLGCNGFVDLIAGKPNGETIAAFRARPESNFHLVIDTLADDSSLYSNIEKFTREHAKYVTIKQQSVSWGGWIKRMTTSVPRIYELLTNPLLYESGAHYLKIVSNMLNHPDFVDIEIQEEYSIEDLALATETLKSNQGFGCIVINLISAHSEEFGDILEAAEAKGLRPKSSETSRTRISQEPRASNGRRRSGSSPKDVFTIE